LQQGYYSGKAKEHTIKYEIGVHPDTGFLVWVGGPIAGAVHDMTLARKSGVLDLVGEKEFILADKGYVGHFHINSIQGQAYRDREGYQSFFRLS
jgi:hypothetical protein